MGARGAILVFCALLSPIAQAQSATDLQRFLDSGVKKESERDFDGAIEAYTQVLKINPRHANALSQRAVARLPLEDYDGAITDSTKAIELDAKSGRSYAVRGLAKFANGDREGARTDGDKAVKLAPKDAYCRFACGKVWYGVFASAISELSEAIRLNPNLAAAWSTRGEYKLHKDDNAGAVEDATHAIEIAPGDPDAYVARGRIHEELREWDKAFADFTKAIEIDPKGITGLLHRGRASESRHDFDEAEKDASKALSIRPQAVSAWTLRAKARLRSGDRKGSVEDYDQALKLRASADLYRARGVAHYADGAWAAAIADFRKGAKPEWEVLPFNARHSIADDGPIWIFLSRSRAGERQEAKQEVAKLFARSLGEDQTKWFQAASRYLTGESTEDEFVSVAGSFSPDTSKYRLTYAWFYIGTLKATDGKIGGAITAFQNCLDIEMWWRDEYIAAAAELERIKKDK